MLGYLLSAKEIVLDLLQPLASAMLVPIIFGCIAIILMLVCVRVAYRIGFQDGRDVGQSDIYKLFSGGRHIPNNKEESHIDAA